MRAAVSAQSTAEASAQQAQRELHALQADVSAEVSHTAKLYNKVAHLKQQLVLLKSEADSSSSSERAATTDLHNSQAELASVELEFKILKADHAAVITEMSGVVSKDTALQEAQRLRSTNGRLKGELKADRTALHCRLDETQRACADLQQQNQKLVSSNNNLQRQHDEACRTLHGLRAEVQRLQSQGAVLQQEHQSTSSLHHSVSAAQEKATSALHAGPIGQKPLLPQSQTRFSDQVKPDADPANTLKIKPYLHPVSTQHRVTL